MEEKWWKQSQSGINFSRKSKSVEHNYPLKRATRGKNFKIILNLGIKGNWRCPECLIHCCCCYCCCCYFYYESMGKISSAFSARHNGKESSCLMLPMPTEYRNRPSYFRTTVILYIFCTSCAGVHGVVVGFCHHCHCHRHWVYVCSAGEFVDSDAVAVDIIMFISQVPPFSVLLFLISFFSRLVVRRSFCLFVFVSFEFEFEKIKVQSWTVFDVCWCFASIRSCFIFCRLACFLSTTRFFCCRFHSILIIVLFLYFSTFYHFANMYI